MPRIKRIAYKVVAFVLLLASVAVPAGLHRLWMRQKYWWLHPLFFAAATVASFLFFFRTPENLEVGRTYAETGRVPLMGEYTNLWLMGFGAAWLLLIVYDALKIVSWPVPMAAEKEEENHV